jgi:hypothetical protein
LPSIRNTNTRLAYARAVSVLLLWYKERGLTLLTIHPLVVAAYVEKLGRDRSAPTAKQHLTAVRRFLDGLVVH